MISIEAQMDEILKDLSKDVHDVTEKSIADVAKESVSQLKNTSPKNPKGKQSGRYASGWSVKKVDKTLVVVYNKTDANLTHLLENGHALVNRDGRTIGRVSGKPHIKPVEEWASDELPERIIRGIDT